MVCDFFCQVEVPIDRRHLEGFADAVARRFPDSGTLRRRIDLLLPIYRIKWCAIMLNDFLPAAAARRAFSASGEQPLERLARQLAMARLSLQRIPHGGN
jgi:hypothetical protein